MRARTPLWVWYLLIATCLLAGAALAAIYARVPGDGASGDLESFAADGFLVRWVLDARPGGLRTGDVIVRAGGHTPEEWLAGAARGSAWRDGGTVTYEVTRDGQMVVLDVPLSTIRPGALFAHWGVQFAVALAFLATGLYVMYRQAGDVAARVLTLFCVLVAVQYVGDAYNIQFSTLAWGWPFWVHLTFEHTIFGLILASMTCFALIFPTVHPVMERHPIAVVAGLFGAFALAVTVTMALAPGWVTAVRWGSHAAWVVGGVELAIAFAAGWRSARVAGDPVSRAQIRWIVWCGTLG
ncbi:MAG TPA: hypothetical protein ENO16_00255, partial [Chromatiales bacterium]|nr:hypothetical protein [Chromatiales bacterium]